MRTIILSAMILVLSGCGGSNGNGGSTENTGGTGGHEQPTGGTGGDDHHGTGGTGGSGGAGGEGGTAPCDDDDGDTVCDEDDLCPGDDAADRDHDGTCDGLDLCPGHDDGSDSDGDGVPYGCDLCPIGDDHQDSDSDGIPDVCDNCAEVSNPDQLDQHGIRAFSIPYMTWEGVAPNTILGLHDDASTGLLPIGFPFTYFGETYDEFAISENGFITLGHSAPRAAMGGEPIPYARTFNGELPINNVIAAAWVDLDNWDVTAIRYGMWATEPNRVLVVGWEGVPRKGIAGSSVKAWAVLHESTSYIELFVDTLPTDGCENAFEFTRGIENAEGTIGVSLPGESYSCEPVAQRSGVWLTTSFEPDGVGDACSNACFDSDTDGHCDGTPADTCPGFDDERDADRDGTPDACDRCEQHDDTLDTDGDGTPDGCDLCPGESDGPDLDHDGRGDSCDDACIGDDATGDTDGDGVCDAADSCASTDDFSADCPWLPAHGGGVVNEYACPQGELAVGVQTPYDDNQDPLGLKLVCKNPETNVTTSVGEWSAIAGDLPVTSLRCDGEHADGRLVGQFVATGPLFETGRYIAGVGLICASESAGYEWTVSPRKAPIALFADPCTGPGEVVTGMKIRTGWLIDDVQLKCTVEQAAGQATDD